MISPVPLTYDSFPEIFYLEQRATDATGKTVIVVARKFFDQYGNAPDTIRYDLRITPKGGKEKSVGWVTLDIKDHWNYVLVSHIENTTLDPTEANRLKGIGSAGLETAFRVSVLIGKEGRLELVAIKDAAFFYYSWGFRFSSSVRYAEVNNTHQIVNTNQLIAKMVDERQTPREGFPMPACFRDCMYLHPEIVIARRELYQI